jgi:transmembrane sensor
MTPPTPPSPPPPQDPDALRLRQDVLEWFVRRHREDWHAPDEHDFQAWLDADPRHRAAYAQWESRWGALDAISPETVALWRRGFQTQGAASGPTRRGFLGPALALGAAGVAVAGYLGWRQLQAQPVFEQAFATRRGQQLDVPLPEGSRLRLDADTRLEVRLLRDRREATLIGGQAVFTVQSDPARPFDVLAGPLQLRSVGTRFVVRHTPGSAGADAVRVSVQEGLVRVLRRNDRTQNALFLAAGQQVQSDAQGVLAEIAAVP